MRDWVNWHAAYADPSSNLAVRLAAVRGHLAAALDAVPPGPVSLVSLCAGQGHDVIGVLPVHPRRDDVTAVLVEFDPKNAAIARQAAAGAGLDRVEVRVGDASLPATYADALPADVLLLCGIFGNVTDADIERTVRAAPGLCAPGGTVIWTRHRRAPDLTPRIRDWFAESGFEEVAFDALATATLTGVGVHRRRPGPDQGQYLGQHQDQPGTPRHADPPGQPSLADWAPLPDQALFRFREAATEQVGRSSHPHTPGPVS